MLTKLKESYYSAVHSPVRIKSDAISEEVTLKSADYQWKFELAVGIVLKSFM